MNPEEPSESAAMLRYDECTKRVRGLMQRWLTAGLSVFLELRRIEESGDWKAPGHATFSDYLRAEFPTALGIERYTNVIAAVDLYGIEFIQQVGIEPCHVLTVEAITSSPAKLDELKGSIETHIAIHGVAPDRNTITDMRNAIAPELLRKHPSTRKYNALVEAQMALRQANLRIRELERENVRLKRLLSDDSGN